MQEGPVSYGDNVSDVCLVIMRVVGWRCAYFELLAACDNGSRHPLHSDPDRATFLAVLTELTSLISY